MYSIDLIFDKDEYPYEECVDHSLDHDSRSALAEMRWMSEKMFEEINAYSGLQTYQFLFELDHSDPHQKITIITGLRFWFDDVNGALMFKLSHV